MDIVGPLPRSRSGNRYVLVICDYATRYPEAVAMRTIDAENVAEELVKLFARVGIPSEILTDQGSNFTSQLLAELYRLLHVRPIRRLLTTHRLTGWLSGSTRLLRQCYGRRQYRKGRIGTSSFRMCCSLTEKCLSAPQDFHPLSYCMGEMYEDHLMFRRNRGRRRRRAVKAWCPTSYP